MGLGLGLGLNPNPYQVERRQVGGEVVGPVGGRAATASQLGGVYRLRRFGLRLGLGEA